MPVHLITISSGKQFEAGADESLLDAALRAGVSLEYSCRTGRCSSCKCVVAEGSTRALHDEVGLSAAELAAGWILSCARAASSDVSLAVNDLGDVKTYPVRTVPCRIQSLERLSADVIKVFLRLPPANDFAYHAGQYIEVIGLGGLRRSYSMANAPAANSHIELHIRQVSDGVMSQYWFEQAQANALLRLNGPLGSFFLRNVSGLDLVFLATGTGIAPVKAMLEELAGWEPDRKPRQVSVYWGGRTAADIYWDPGTSGVEHRFVPVLSRPDAGWGGARGHVQQALLADLPQLQETMIYACGSDAMIHGARAQLTAAGLPEEHFRSDAFVCSAAA
jgi:CDP-4-dehydro-6-deoxyglucose reductase